MDKGSQEIASATLNLIDSIIGPAHHDIGLSKSSVFLPFVTLKLRD